MTNAKRNAFHFALAIVVVPQAAAAGEFSVPSGPLGKVAATLGRQADITITVADPALARRHSQGVVGSLPVERAVAQLLAGTDAQAVYQSPSVIILRRRAPVSRSTKLPTPPGPMPPSLPTAEIIVTGSKQQLTTGQYPGAVKIMDLSSRGLDSAGHGSVAALINYLPSLSATHFGPGRDKIFIRGVADSSFTGVTQATSSQYLGDIRLNYNAPDPDLSLYDVERVEILVGPQGTLYGAGSLGGVIRLVPTAPDTSEFATTFAVGTTATQHGAPGADGALMVNLPIIKQKATIRLVGWGQNIGGYIDDSQRRLKDINRSDILGIRGAVRAENVAGWTLELGGIAQQIRSDDRNYASSVSAPLSRTSAIAQPFASNYGLGYVSANREIGGLDLVSTTSFMRHRLKSVFDPSLAQSVLPIDRFDEANKIGLISHETRLSNGRDTAPWVVGMSALYNRSIQTRYWTVATIPLNWPRIVNRQIDIALFGQTTLPISHNMYATIGGRLLYAWSRGTLGDASAPLAAVTRNTVRFSPAAALDWRPVNSISAYIRYQEGFRVGGLGFAATDMAISGRRFVPDQLNLYEVGIRTGRKGSDALTLQLNLFKADWKNMQADLIEEGGLTYISNLGRGRIEGVDLALDWRIEQNAFLNLGIFVNRSGIDVKEASLELPGKQPLPNIAKAGVRVAGQWRHSISHETSLSLEPSANYVGRSKLGVGSLLNLDQGNYVTAKVAARLTHGPYELSVDIDNLFDSKASSFAYGNPFEMYRKNLITPLRPRSVRIGISAEF